MTSQGNGRVVLTEEQANLTKTEKAHPQEGRGVVRHAPADGSLSASSPPSMASPTTEVGTARSSPAHGVKRKEREEQGHQVDQLQHMVPKQPPETKLDDNSKKRPGNIPRKINKGKLEILQMLLEGKDELVELNRDELHYFLHILKYLCASDVDISTYLSDMGCSMERIKIKQVTKKLITKVAIRITRYEITKAYCQNIAIAETLNAFKVFIKRKFEQVQMLLEGKDNLVKLNRDKVYYFLDILDYLYAPDVDISTFLRGMGCSMERIKIKQVTKKMIAKVATRLTTHYEISKVYCRNIAIAETLNAFKVFIKRKFEQKKMSLDAFRELIEVEISWWGTETTTIFYEDLVRLLVENHENEEAFHWTSHFNLPDRKLPNELLEFRQNKAASASGGNGGSNEEEKVTAYYSLILPQENIFMVETVDQLDEFCTQIKRTKRRCTGCRNKPGCVIALDTEWRPNYHGQKIQVALIQVATRKHIYLLDACKLRNDLDDKGWQKLARALFCRDKDNPTLVYGKDDVRGLMNSFPAMNEVIQQMKGVIDIHQALKLVHGQARAPDEDGMEVSKDKGPDKPGQPLGLSDMVKKVLGKLLDKSEQVSDWERRPLRAAQPIYAALDAYVLLDLYDYWTKKAQEQGIELDGQIFLQPKDMILQPSVSRSQLCQAKGSKKNNKPPRCTSPNKQRQLAPMAVRKFRVVLDSSLKGLQRELRLCGADAIILENNASLDELVEICQKEGRIVLYKDEPFLEIQSSVGEENCYEMQEEAVKNQVVEVFSTFKIYVTEDDIFSRCSKCNGDQFINLSGPSDQQLARDNNTDKECATCRNKIWQGMLHKGIMSYKYVLKECPPPEKLNPEDSRDKESDYPQPKMVE